MLPIGLIDDFEGHPFQVKDDADMTELVSSIKQVGLLEPATVIRNQKKFGRYEMVAGHRRKHAAALAGLTQIPVIVRDMDHDEATIYMVDSNLKREKLTPMEKARAYTMKTEALRRKMGRRSKEEIRQMEAEGKKPMTADQQLAQQTGESVATVQRFKTLTKLTEPLQKMVDKGDIPVNTAADIAQMKPEEQNVLANAIEREAKVPSGTKAKELKEESRAGTLTTEKIEKAVAPTKREIEPPLKITLGEEDLRPYFPDKTVTIPDVKRGIFEALDLRKRAIERQKAKAREEKEGKKKPPTPSR
jgi:ParB-like chromosome segregation protein Spo0J